MTAAKNLPEAMSGIQDTLRTLNDSGHKYTSDDIATLAALVGSLANVVDALVHDEDVPSEKGVAIR
ncbi:hypothetical protein EDF38_1283 [Frigoribacterium sp. PhB160]|uniref:hypothetical protein n=1 Tax=Frigoribacterium sp. PhB160 TaxID=2485192 RepID=UPI000F4ACD29|nr:hypothetical protein [Frigoribacterium sp. PhB160]ROS62180.1 hypothetical protein EDF38_1283 [Frigoribacterium sp. PhB160]